MKPRMGYQRPVEAETRRPSLTRTDWLRSGGAGAQASRESAPCSAVGSASAGTGPTQSTPVA